jgi:hypothetical protein
MKFIYHKLMLWSALIRIFIYELKLKVKKYLHIKEKGDVPGWILVVLMTTALVTGIWSIAAPRLSSILKDSLDSMGTIR